MELELRTNLDGTLALNFWDSIGGQDMCLRIAPDGRVEELSFPPGEDETEIWTPIDLVARLFALANDHQV